MNEAARTAQWLAEVGRGGGHFLPELVLTAALLLVVLADATLARWRGRVCQVLTLAGLAAAFVLVVADRDFAGRIWFGMLSRDALGVFFSALVLGAALLVVASFTFRNAGELAGLGPGEFYALM